MPNQTIYLDTINYIEENVGISFINKDRMAEKLQESWKNDKTLAKSDYLKVYSDIFRDVLQKWSERELSNAFYARSEKMPDFKKCLLQTDESLKLCAMSLIPELRENADILSHMTFGVMEPAALKNEFLLVRQKYLQVKESESMAKKRKIEAYAKYKQEWQSMSTRKLTEFVRDKNALRLMSEDEKLDYTLALDAYRHDTGLARPLDTREKELIDDALSEWRQELNVPSAVSLDDFVGNKYFQYAEKLAKNEWIDKEINAAVDEFNKSNNPAEQEIEHYKEVEKTTADLQRLERETKEKAEQQKEEKELKRTKERIIHNEGVTDNIAESVGGFFQEAEITKDIQDIPARSSRAYYEKKITDFNQKYSLRVNKEKVRDSIEKMTALMIKAREEKEHFMSKDSIVIVENGVERCYAVKDYYKKGIEDAHTKYVEEMKKLEEERALAEKNHKESLEKIARQESLLEKPALDRLKSDEEKIFKDKLDANIKSMAAAKRELEKTLAKFEGGIVIERNGNTEKRHKASQYYETHETKKEQRVYGEYQKHFSLIFKDACKNFKEANYEKGKITDFSLVAKDLDKLFKSVMYAMGIYNDPKNKEVVQKCSFGGFSAEQLASFVSHFKDDSWAFNQTNSELWVKQSKNAQEIYNQWRSEEKTNPKVKPAIRIKEVLNKQCAEFKKGGITRKEMLDYMIAAEAHLQKDYPTNWKKVTNLIQYNRERNALLECRAAFGLTEEASLRIAMNLEYSRMSQTMSKEEIFKAIKVEMLCAPTFNEEKRALAEEHKAVEDRLIAEKNAELAQLREKDKEPISIPELDPREEILNKEPRVKPIQPTLETQKGLNINKG